MLISFKPFCSVLSKKGEDIRLSHMTKAHTHTWKIRDNTKTPPKASIPQQFRTDLGRSVGATTAIQRLWLNRITVSQRPTNYKSCVIKRTHIIKYVNNPNVIKTKDQQPTKRRGHKIITQTCKVIKIVYQKILYKDVRQRRLCSAVWKRAQIQGLKEQSSRGSGFRASSPLSGFDYFKLYSLPSLC